MSTLTVGPGQQFSTIAAAVAASQAGDVIQVQAGTYTNDFATISHDLTLEAVGGRVNLVATIPPPDLKGYFLVGTIGDAPNVSISGFSFSGVSIPKYYGNNGAGIRYQGGNLTLSDDSFSNNQEGLLATPLVNNTGTIAITDSLFDQNGAGDGQSHNIYVNHVADFSITDSLVENAVVGHEIKSRALNTTIENDLIYEGPQGTGSYSVDLPNGGNATITNNVIEKGPQSQNPSFIEYGFNGGLPGNSSLTVSGNTILSNYSGTPTIIANYSTVTAQFSNNQTYGVPDSHIAFGPAAISNTTDLATEPALNLTPPWEQTGGVHWLASSVVPIPGAGGSIISYTFDTAQNAALAEAVAAALVAASTGGSLNAAVYNGSDTAPTVPGQTNELVVAPSTAGSIVFTPGGYTYSADGTNGGAFSIVGAQNFIGGNGNLTVYDAVVSGPTDTIVAGDGNDLFGLNAGTTYNVAAGNGADTFFADGTGTVTGGSGNNLFYLGGTGTTDLVLSHGQDTVALGAGAATVATYGNAPLIYGGDGSLEVFSNGSTNETVAGGSGPQTIFGATSGLYVLGSSTSLFIGNPSSTSTIVGTTGQETVFGGVSSSETIFNNTSSLLFVSVPNDSTTIVGGANQSTLFGAAGSSITYSGSAGGALYAAAAGNETLNAAGSSANNLMFSGNDTTAGSPNDSLAGGSGNDTLVAGTGNDTLAGGSGSNLFVFIQGNAGGVDLISDFNSNDLLFLAGYGSAAGAAALAAATVSGGATTIALSDHTQITFQNITTPSSIQTFSV